MQLNNFLFMESKIKNIYGVHPSKDFENMFNGTLMVMPLRHGNKQCGLKLKSGLNIFKNLPKDTNMDIISNFKLRIRQCAPKRNNAYDSGEWPFVIELCNALNYIGIYDYFRVVKISAAGKFYVDDEVIYVNNVVLGYPISIDTLLSSNSDIPKMLVKSPNVFKFLNYEDQKKNAVCFIRMYPHMIGEICDEFVTESMCLEAVSCDGNLLKYIKNNQQTYKICLAAVKQDGYALEFAVIKPFSVCKAAYDQNNDAIKYMSNNMKNKILGLVPTSKVPYTKSLLDVVFYQGHFNKK